MAQSEFRIPCILSIVILLLAAAASAGGLLIDGLYRDNAFVVSASHGSDLVTLIVALPMMTAAMILSRRGSIRGQLIWFGMLDYMLYNYAFYLFGSAFNSFFLLYTAIFTLSILALIFALAAVDVEGIGRRFGSRTPVRVVGGYMLIVALGLSGIYIQQSVNFIVAGTLPSIVVISGHPTSVVFALDLSLLVPWLVIGAVRLWKRRPWGYVIGSIVCIKGATYTLVLTVGSFIAANAGTPQASSEMPLWLSLTAAGAIASLLLLMNLRSKAEGEGWNVESVS